MVALHLFPIFSTLGKHFCTACLGFCIIDQFCMKKVCAKLEILVCFVAESSMLMLCPML